MSDEKLDLILEKLDSIDNALDHHEKMLVQLMKITASNNTSISDIKSDIAELIKGQERQDRILESLAARSLEQETEIRDLKRK